MFKINKIQLDSILELVKINEEEQNKKSSNQDKLNKKIIEAIRILEKRIIDLEDG